MAESEQLVAALKQRLKNQGKTYRDVAQALHLSEPSVKRLFASGRFTVERMVEVANLLGYTLAELSHEAQALSPRLSSLSEQQERELVSDTRLLIVAVCALNQWKLDEIMQYYRIGEAECVRHLLHLDRLGIIALLPGNRIRLNIARDFDWRPGGPIQRYFRGKGLPDFIKSRFESDDEALAFVNGMLTEPARAKLQEELRKLRRRFAELHEESLAAPLDKRYGTALLLATRRWEPEDFAKYRK